MQNRRAALACFAVAAAGGWMLMAGAGSGGDTGPSEERAVEATVDAYVKAFVSGDGRAACGHLTAEARKAVADRASEVGARGCEQAFAKSRELGGAAVTKAAAGIRVRQIHVTGTTARVTLRTGEEDSVAELQKVGGTWRIASLPRS